jgi:hypothetical protein
VVLTDTDTIWLRDLRPYLAHYAAAHVFTTTDCNSHVAETYFLQGYRRCTISYLFSLRASQLLRLARFLLRHRITTNVCKPIHFELPLILRLFTSLTATPTIQHDELGTLQVLAFEYFCSSRAPIQGLQPSSAGRSVNPSAGQTIAPCLIGTTA